MIDKVIIVLFSKCIINELYILLTEQKQTKNMDRETRDLEKHLQRTPRKKDNQVISNLFFYDFDLGVENIISRLTK